MRFDARPTTSATSPPRSTSCSPAPTPWRSPAPGPPATPRPGLKLWSRLAEQGVDRRSADRRPRPGRARASPSRCSAGTRSRARGSRPRRTCPRRRSAARLDGRRHRGACRRTCRTPSTPTSPTHVLRRRRRAAHGDRRRPGRSVDPTRRLFEVTAGDAVETRRPRAGLRPGRAGDRPPSCSALGERLLADSVAYVKQRKQFGREIGSYQAIKHQLADVRIALDFARPLVYGAARSARRPCRDVSAAKVACADAAYLAARDRLQVHGAIGYTAGVRPEPLDHQGPRPGRRLGHAGVPPRPRCSTRWCALMELRAHRGAAASSPSTVAVAARQARRQRAVRARGRDRAGYDEALWQLLCEQIGVAALGDPGGVRRRRASRCSSRWSSSRSSAASLTPVAAAVDAGRRRRRCSPAPTRTPASGCSPGSRPARSAASSPGDAPVLDGDLATVLVVATDDGLFEVDRRRRADLDARRWTRRSGSRRSGRPRVGDPDRRRHRGARAGRAGRRRRRRGAPGRLRAPRPGHDGRLHQGAGAVRPADRLLPGAQAPDGRHARAASRCRVPASWAASYAVATAADDAERLAHVAKACCCEALAHVAAETVQLHGGIAITWEHDAQLVFKRAHALGQLFGAPHEHRALVAL